MAKARKNERPQSAGREQSAEQEQGPGAVSAVELLMQDHREVETLFEQFERLEDGSPERIALMREISFKLALHARLEEEIVYPMARVELGEEALHLADEAEVEHASLKHLLVELSGCDGTERLFAAKVKVLSEYVNHHVEEEEGELLPMLEEAGVDLQAMGERILERKKAYLRAYLAEVGDREDADASSDDEEKHG
jgi:hypothetical protein